MRSRPIDLRVTPKSVVECIEPDLLLYICRYELSKRYRTNRPSKVDAMAVHEWVMSLPEGLVEAEDNEGIRQLRALTCNLGGKNGVREVQQLFVKVRKLRRLYRLRTTQRQIIT